jgi:hypothetical protein
MDIKFAPAGTMPEAPEKISMKSAKRRVQFDRAKTLFEAGRQYTESEVNILLMQLFEDHIFARRALVTDGFLDRTKDGATYWVIESETV